MTKYFNRFIPIMALIATFGFNITAPVQAGDEPNLLVMGEDADKDTVSRNNRVFKRVLGALSNQLVDEGFKVFDETAVTLDDFAQGRIRRTDAEIIDIAKMIKRPPIDVSIIFSIYASAKNVGYTTKVRTRIEGRILNVKTGQRLGNFEVETPKSWNAPAKCNRECILEVVGKNSRIIANDLGAVLTQKLAWMTDGRNDLGGDDRGGLENAFNLIFDNFTPDEVQDIEEYLVIFSGYEAHRPTYSSARRAEYWYESSIKSAKLNRNLTKMLAHLDLHGMVTFSDNTFTVKKITLRGKKNKKPSKDDW